MASRGRTATCVGVCVCHHCVCLCVMACYGAFSSISHMLSLPKACGIVEEKNGINVILSLCSSSPQSLFLPLHTHTPLPPLLLPVSPVHQWVVMFGIWPQSQESQDARDAAKSVHAGKSYHLWLCLSLHMLETSKWDDSASSKYSFIYCSNFTQTNVFIVKEGRLI